MPRTQRGLQQQLDALGTACCTVFLLAMFCFFPLYIDTFSNLGLTKFSTGAALLLAGSLALGAVWAIGAHPVPGRLPVRDGTLWALGAVVVGTALSTAFSLSPTASVWGLGGYYGGCVMALLTAAGYLAVRAFARAEQGPGLVLGIGATAAVVAVLYLLNIFNIDLIGAYENTAVVERAQFFSTLGQKNFNGGYFAIVLPIIFYAFLQASTPRRAALYAVPALFGALALVVVDAEGLALGLGTAALVLLCSRDFTVRTLRRAALLGAAFFGWAGWMYHMRQTVYTQGGTPVLAGLGRPAVALPGVLVCAVIWAVLWAAAHPRGGTVRDWPLYCAGRCVTMALLCGVALLVLLANVWPGFPDLGRLNELLVFNDAWGTHRGLAWRICAAAWWEQPLCRKLLGVGPGMTHAAIAAWAGDALTPRMATFYAAHNEYLELLLTTGVAGLAAWLWFCAAHLRRGFAAWQRPGVAPVLLALCSYLAQAAVSIRVSMNFPLVMLLFALLAALCAAPEPAQTDGLHSPRPGAKTQRPPQNGAASSPARRWGIWVLAALVLTAVCGAAGRILFGFLW